MKLLSDDRALEWCRDRGIHGEGSIPRTFLRYDGGSSERIQLRMHADAIAQVGFAFSSLLAETPSDSDATFHGGLVWLRRWNLWSESIDAVGYRLLDGLRDAREGVPSLNEAPAHLCLEEDFVTAHSLLALAVLFQWDAYYVPSSGHFLIFVSHEGTVDILSRTAELRLELAARFRELEPVQIE